MTYFKNFTTLEELKAEYRKQAKLHHPDNGGSKETMQEINKQFETAYNKLDSELHNNNEEHKTKKEDLYAFMHIINAIINYKNIKIEIIGTWLWVSGETKPHKEELHLYGFKWSSNKNAWYWYEGKFMKHSKKAFSMDEIRAKHGSREVKKDGDKNQTRKINKKGVV